MTSASTCPGPTEGSWSTSPTISSAASSGTAASSDRMRGTSTIEVSSTTSRPQSSGFSPSRLNPPVLGSTSSSRWIVFASNPVASLIRFAARLRLRLDDIEHLFAERADQLAGVDRADAPDHPRAEILLDPLGGRRLRGADEACPELLAVGAVVHPFARGRNPFSRRHGCGVSDHGDQVAMAARPGSEDAEAVLRIVEGDALHRPGQDLPVRRSPLPAGAGFQDVPSDGAASSSLTNSKRRAPAAEAARSSSPGS